MYKVDKEKNQIIEIPESSFSELGFTERHHLQEWLASNPGALGEELLIIQKEFDGFDDTRERLDLLALDKTGNLVIIENKLDDSGRDVVWQALKYASYCSSMTKQNILDVYQLYLNKYGEDNASDLISEFLDVVDLDEVVLNNGSGQRLILVAATFRKEVTSTALWLISHGIEVQCFKVTPFQHEGNYFLTVGQVIPPPEAKELMIGMSEKEAEAKHTETVKRKGDGLRYEFWDQCLEALRNSNCNLFDRISPGTGQWLTAGSGLRACPFTMIFGVNEIRVQFEMVRESKEENKWVFDHLIQNRQTIDASFGKPLEWLRLDEKKACRVYFAHPINAYERENWSAVNDWFIEHLNRLERAFSKDIPKVGRKLKERSS